MVRLLPPTLLMLLGCSGVLDALDTTPATVRVTAPSGPVLSAKPLPLDPHVLTKGGKELPEEVGKLAWSVTPAGVADATGGSLRCLGTGDASVLVTGSGVSTTFSVSCRIVASISVPADLTLLVGEPPAAMSLQALDASGRAMPDVTPTATSTSPGVVDVANGAANGLAVGNATIEVTAGDARATIPVTVMERYQTDTLALSDGQTIAYTLTRGRYAVEVNVRASDGSGYGVEVQAAGGGCPPQSESTTHRFECTVNDTTSLVLTNPTTFGFGPPEMGNITIYRIP